MTARDSRIQKGESMQQDLRERAITAWETEPGDIVVWGTHDEATARRAIDAYAEEVGADFSGDNAVDLSCTSCVWAHPAAIDIEDEPWPRSFQSREPRDGWVPVMLVIR